MSVVLYKLLQDKQFKPLRFMLVSWAVLVFTVVGSAALRFAFIADSPGEVFDVLPETGTYELCNSVAAAQNKGELTREQERYLDVCGEVIDFDRAVDVSILQSSVALMGAGVTVALTLIFLSKAGIVRLPVVFINLLDDIFSKDSWGNIMMSTGIFFILIAVFFMIDTFI